MVSPKRVLEDIYVVEDSNYVVLGNSEMELGFSKSSGAWVKLVDKVTGANIIGHGAEVATEYITVGGKTVRKTGRGIAQWPYNIVVDAVTLGSKLRYVSHSHEATEGGVKLRIYSEMENWRLESSYTIKPQDALVERGLVLTYLGQEDAQLRYVEFLVPNITLGKAADCVFEAPGVSVKSHYPVMEIPEGRWIGASAPHGTPGLFGLHNPSGGLCLLVWGYSGIEPSHISVDRAGDSLSITQRLLVADNFSKGHTVSCGSQFIRISRKPWNEALESFRGWYDSVGLKVPEDIPEYARRIKLYECQIGPLGGDGRLYAPFKEVKDLIERLLYIKDLGFNTIQLMPHMPFPSYAIEDFYSIDRVYGPEAEIRRLIETAHKLGMKVILDLIVHGVIDKSIVDARKRVEMPVRPEFADQVGESPILRDHPEWFMRTETGEIDLTYTYAFDFGNEEWHQYIIDVMKFHLQDLGADGWRVDAPTWNYFPNWDPNIPYRASYGYFGVARLLEKARKVLKAINPNALICIEAYGPLWNKSADLTYNYDEHWIPPAILPLLSEEEAKGVYWQRRGPAITAKDAAEWLQQRMLAYPKNAVRTRAHHLDSHDTWYRKGRFFREVFGSEAARAFFAFNAFLDGSLMNYVGGEDGSVEFYRNVIRVRDGVPELTEGECDYTAVKPSDDMVFTVLRSLNGNHTVVVINFNQKDTVVELTMPTERIGALPQNRYILYDVLNDKLLKNAERICFNGDELRKIRLEIQPYETAVILLRKILD